MKRALRAAVVWMFHYLFWLLITGSTAIVLIIGAADIKAFRYMGF